MDLNRLKIFLEVARLKSFSRAADSLFLSQPTVSSHIKSLEANVGAPLFERRHPRPVLTREGQTFLKYAGEIVALEEKALEEVKGQFANQNAQLTLAASSVPGAFLLPPLLKEFLSSYPGVTYSVAEKDSAGVLEELQAYTCDVGLVGSKIPDPKLKFCRLTEDQLVLVAAPEIIPSGAKKPNSSGIPSLNMDSLAEIPLLLREPGSGTRSVLEKGLAEKNIQLKDMQIKGYWESPQAILNSAIAGLGATFVSKRTVEKHLEQGNLQCCLLEDLPLKRFFYMVYLKNRTLHPLVVKFIKFVQEYYNKSLD